jgi:hypothetical protein
MKDEYFKPDRLTIFLLIQYENDFEISTGCEAQSAATEFSLERSIVDLSHVQSAFFLNSVILQSKIGKIKQLAPTATC